MHIQAEFTRELERRNAERDLAYQELHKHADLCQALYQPVHEERQKERQLKREEREEAQRQRIQEFREDVRSLARLRGCVLKHPRYIALLRSEDISAQREQTRLKSMERRSHLEDKRRKISGGTQRSTKKRRDCRKINSPGCMLLRVHDA